MEKMPMLSAASLILTENCNLACKYCPEVCSRSTANMTEEIAEKAIEILVAGAKNNNDKEVHIEFFGGEPLLNVATMRHAFDYANRRCTEEGIGFSCIVITNATMFTQEYEDFLLHWHKTKGKINVQLSIDGPPEIQNTNRVTQDGGPSSDMIEKTVKQYFDFLNKNNIPIEQSVHVHSVLSIETAKRLYEVYSYIRDLGFNGVWYMPVHEEPWSESDVVSYRVQLQKVADRIYEDCVDQKTTSYYQATSSLSRCTNRHPDQPCGIGRKFCSVAPNGDIYPCHYVYFMDKEHQDTKLGNVYDGINDDMRSFFLDYGTENMMGDKPCADCEHYACYRCPAMNLKYNKNYLIGFKDYCKMSRAENAVKLQLQSRMAQAGLITPQSNNSCSAGNCTCNKPNQPGQIPETLMRVIHNTEEHLKSIVMNTGQAKITSDQEFATLNDKLNTVITVLGELTKVVIILAEK